MSPQINILYSRKSVAEALKLCLHYSHYEFVEIYQTLDEKLIAAQKNEVHLIDSEIISSFLNEQKGDLIFSVLVISDNDPLITEALYAGAKSFINISKGAAQFVTQVDLIAENKSDESSQLIRNFLLEKVSPTLPLSDVDYNLTKQEIVILKMMCEAKHLKLIAHETDSSYETVRTHVKRIYRKLGVMSASEAVIKAMKMKL